MGFREGFRTQMGDPLMNASVEVHSALSGFVRSVRVGGSAKAPLRGLGSGPGSGEWAAWWKKVGGDPEKYWKNEPVFGYPQTWLGHLLRWSFGAFCVVVMIWGMAACVRLRSG